MIGEAKFDVVKIPGLTEIFSSTDGHAAPDQALYRSQRRQVSRFFNSAGGASTIEDWQRIGVNFAGMPEIMQMYLQIAAGAADIPGDTLR